ncbi:MAG: TonB family protein [Opitutae bacterium]|nr:TonB family protein [Opitutae bacterium]
MCSQKNPGKYSAIRTVFRWFALLPTLLIALMGCHTSSRRGFAGGVAERIPKVTLESVVPALNSPAPGYLLPLNPMPLFPWELLRAGVTGEVVVRLTVDRQGKVADAVIAKSTIKEFEASVLSVARSWRFQDFPKQERQGLIVDCTIRFGYED